MRDFYIGLKLEDEKLKEIGAELLPLENLSIKKQCEKAEIPLKTVELSAKKSDEPELQAKDYLLRREDFDYVYFMEGRFTFLFQLMFFDYVYNHEYENHLTYTTKVGLIFEEEHKDNLLDIVRNMTSEKLRRNMEALNKREERAKVPEGEGGGWHYVKKEEKEKFQNIFSAIDKKKLVEASKVYISENSFYKGWPDLVAVKLSSPSRLTFFEVKTTDNLLAHQMFIVHCFRDKANLDMRVLKLVYD